MRNRRVSKYVRLTLLGFALAFLGPIFIRTYWPQHEPYNLLVCITFVILAVLAGLRAMHHRDARRRIAELNSNLYF